MKVRIDALDITVIRGGSDQVGQWASDHGFRLPPDAPECSISTPHARRSSSPRCSMPMPPPSVGRPSAMAPGPHHDPPKPMVPLRPGSRKARRSVEADVYSDGQDPALLPAPDGSTAYVGHSAAASDLLLSDLRATREWMVPRTRGSKVRIDASAPQSGSISQRRSGAGQPSRIAAGLDLPGTVAAPDRRPTSACGCCADLHGWRHRRNRIPAAVPTTDARRLSGA